MTGQLAGPGYGSADYWVEHVRRPVRFVDGVRLAESLGAGVFVEVGPGAALTAAVEQSLATEPAASVVTMAKDRPEVDSLLGAPGSCSPPAWTWTGPRRSPAWPPTGSTCRRMPFSGAGFGCRPSRWARGTCAGLGLIGAEHALLGAVVERPDSGGVVLTGRLSTAAQPWLADHAVTGMVLFPGAGFVELTLRAGDEVGCPVIEELTLSAPLLVPATGGMRVQVVVDAAGESGSRAVAVYSQAGSEWMLHAQGVLSAARPRRQRICRCGRRSAPRRWM